MKDALTILIATEELVPRFRVELMAGFSSFAHNFEQYAPIKIPRIERRATFYEMNSSLVKLPIIYDAKERRRFAKQLARNISFAWCKALARKEDLIGRKSRWWRR